MHHARQGAVGQRLAVVVGLRPGGGAVHELVRDDERARTVLRPQPAHRARPQHLPHPERAQRPQVGPVVDPVRRNRVRPPVPRQERHPPATHRTDEHRVARRPVRRVDGHLDHIVEQRVQPRTADHAELGPHRAPIVRHVARPFGEDRQGVQPKALLQQIRGEHFTGTG